MMRRQAIESALPTVATVICAMIDEYASQLPHKWTIEPIKWFRSNFSKDDAIQPIRLNQTGSRSQVDWITDRHSAMYNRWYIIVSDVDLHRGDWTWSVEIVANVDCIGGYYYVGVGVTKLTESTVELMSDAKPEPNCIVAKISFNGNVGDGFGDLIRIDDHTKATCRFVADPIRRRISMLYGIAGSDKIAETVLFTAETDAEFDALRPCVLLRDRSTAIIASPVPD